MKKRLLSLLLAFVLVVGLLPGAALAAETSEGDTSAMPRPDSLEFAIHKGKDGTDYIPLQTEISDAGDYTVFIPDIQADSEATVANNYYLALKGSAAAPAQPWLVYSIVLPILTKVSYPRKPLDSSEWSNLGTSFSQIGDMKIYVCEEKPTKTNVGTLGTPFSVDIVQTPTISDLSVVNNVTMAPDFSWGCAEYTVSVPYDAQTVELSAVSKNKKGADLGYTYTFNGSESSTVPVHWDAEGKMTVAVKVINSDVVKAYGEAYGTRTYTLHLSREEQKNEPVFSLQPKGSSYYDAQFINGFVGYVSTTATPLEVRATAKGEVSYQWYANTENSTEGGNAIEGATSETYTPFIPDVGRTQEVTTYYYCVASNVVDGQTYTTASDIAAIVVTPHPYPNSSRIVLEDGSEIPEGTVYVYPYGSEDTVTLKGIYDSDAEGGTWEVEWIRGEGDHGHYLSEQGQTITIPTDKAGVFELYMQSAHTVAGRTFREHQSGKNRVKFVITTDHVEKPDIYKHPQSEEYIAGTAVLHELSMGANPTGPGGTLSYQWQISTDGVNYRDATETDGSLGNYNRDFTPVGTGSTTYYRCMVTCTLDYEYDGVRYYFTAEAPTEPAVITYKQLDFQGKGTADDPFLLENVDDVVSLQQAVNSGTTFEGLYFKLTSDITLPDNWEPIGTMTNWFSGNIDGDNHQLTIPYEGLPLLGRTNKASVRNLKIYGSKIEGYGLVNIYTVTREGTCITIENVTLMKGTKTLHSGFIGGYASGVDNVVIRNCTIQEGVTIGFRKQDSNIGGFAGELNGTIENCVNHGTVYGVNYVGGIVGNKGQTMGAFEIKNCSFDGTVEATGDYVGGITGGGYAGTQLGLDSAPNTPCASIQNCLVSGTVKGRDYAGGIFGGEPGLNQCWDNGIGYIRSNLFAGTVTADGSNVGGIIGRMNSLNKYNIIENNYFKADCGAEKGIGRVGYVDTSAAHETAAGAVYFDTSKELPSVNGVIRSNHNRTDDPLGADKDKLSRAASTTELTDGTILNLLNTGAGSFGNWEAGTEQGHPVLSNKPVLLSMELGGNYKTTYYLGEDFSTEGMELTGVLSDGSRTSIPAAEVSVSGYDNTVKGTQVITLTHGAVHTSFEIVMRQPQTGSNTVSVSFRLIGSTLSDGDVDLGSGNYQGAAYVTWIPTDSYTVARGSVVLDVFEAALTGAGIRWHNKGGNYIDTIYAPDGYELSEFTNGPRSGWMYTLNGKHVPWGVEEQEVHSGDVIIFHYVDDYAYEVEDWSGIGGDEYPALGDGTYYNAWLKAADRQIPTGTETLPDEKVPLGELPFLDVAADAWYAEAVQYVFEQKLFAGTSDTTFDPNVSMSRAMLAAVLYRLAEKPAVTGSNPFADVAAGTWYTDAVIWADANKIVYGTGSGFEPDRDITRQELVAMLYRYAKFVGMDMTKSTNLTNFTDNGQVADWAKESMSWAVANGLVAGRTTTTLVPTGTATRAEVAAILQRMVGLMVK